MQRSFGEFRLDDEEQVLTGPGGPVPLSGPSLALLGLFLDRPGDLIGKGDLLDAVWPGVAVEENTLQVHMSGLRKALGPGFISTVHGRGYRYVGPPPQDAGLGATVTSEMGNLGRYRVECVAREVERAALVELVRRQRLVSVLGAGGVGKTTLALSVAASVAAEFDDRVWVIDLAPLAAGELIESTIIQTLGIPFRANVPPIRAIAEALRGQRLLLVLDNCEHLIAAAKRVSEALLDEVPGLQILATTQAPLEAREEHVFRLAPFALGEDGDEQSVRFLDHCYAALGESLSAEDLPIVLRLCRRLDGVALALKMAAARASTLGIEAVDRQIGEQLAGLAASWQPSLERHRSLMASLAWSYQLLSPGEQETLRALGVFQGSFTLDGVRAVAGAAADDSLSELVRRSIVVRDGGDRSRYRLLETTRHFALERLVAAGEDAAARTAHARHMLAAFTAGLSAWETVPDRQWLAAHQPDADNLRAALEWSRTQQDWPLHLGLAGQSYRFWIQNQLPAEGLAVAVAAHDHVDAVPVDVAAALNLALAELYRFYRLDYRTLDHLAQALPFFDDGHDQRALAQLLLLRGLSQTVLRDQQSAGIALERLDAITGNLPPSKVKGRALVMVGVHHWNRGDKAFARIKLQAGLAMHRAMGNMRGLLKSTMLSAEGMHQTGDTREAIALVMAEIAEIKAHGTREEYSGQLSNLAVYHMSLGEFETARPLIAQCAILMPRDDKNAMWCLIQNAAELKAHDGEFEAAAMLLGHADAGFDSWEDGRQQTEERQRQRIVAMLEAAGMDAVRRDYLGRQGRALSQFEAETLGGVGQEA